MHVILIHGRKPTVALVDSLDNLPCSYEDIITSEDARKISTDKGLQSQLQNIFREVLGLHGIHVRLPNDPGKDIEV
jgi:hypothetical protein